MDVIPLGIVMFCKEEQYSKALLPIDERLSGRFMYSSSEQPANADPPIVVILLFNRTFVNFEQSPNTHQLIAVTWLGIIISCKFLHPLNASSPIAVILSGSDMLANATQSLKTPFPIVLMFSVSVTSDNAIQL